MWPVAMLRAPPGFGRSARRLRAHVTAEFGIEHTRWARIGRAGGGMRGRRRGRRASFRLCVVEALHFRRLGHDDPFAAWLCAGSAWLCARAPRLCERGTIAVVGDRARDASGGRTNGRSRRAEQALRCRRSDRFRTLAAWALDPFRLEHPLRVLAEGGDVMRTHLADRAGRQIAEQERTVPCSDQPRDLQPQEFEHAADFAVLAFGQDHLDPYVRPGATFEVRVDRAVAHALRSRSRGSVPRVAPASLARKRARGTRAPRRSPEAPAGASIRRRW